MQSGLYFGSTAARYPAAFNTGQVILGWCRAYQETGDERYLDAAIRAGAWLAKVQAPDGSWRLHSPVGEATVHAYDVRTAWSLLEIDSVAGKPIFREAALLNLEWTLNQQRENGWFYNNAFFVSNKWTLPFTHNIAYVMEGFFESWRLLGDERYLKAVKKTAERLLRLFEQYGFMPGEFDESWSFNRTYSCLTGDAQIADVWLRLFEQTGETRYLAAAVHLNEYVKRTQDLSTLHPGIRGGVKGSQPITGRYTPFTYVNWAAKFFADSLMLEERVIADLKKRVFTSGQENLQTIASSNAA